jgi:hypothetical protein
VLQFEILKGRSFIFKINNNGPSIELEYSMIYWTFIRKSISHDAQSGFISNHSCQTALVNIIDKWIEERNNRNVNVVILLDLKIFKINNNGPSIELEVLHDLLDIY